MLARRGTSSLTSPAGRKKRPSGQVTTQEAGQAAVETYKNLAALVLETSRQSAGCLNELLGLHKGLMTGVEEFLSVDDATPGLHIDEPALAIVQECSRAFEGVASTFETGFRQLKQVCEAVEEVQVELERVSASLGDWSEAVAEQEHYESKVDSLRQQTFPSHDKLRRNADKLEQSKQRVSDVQEVGWAELGHFSEKRPVTVRATLIAYLRVYLQMLSSCGGLCDPVSQQSAAELLPGRRAEIVALRKARELNGLTVTIEGVDPADLRRCTVVLDGSAEKKSVKVAHLLPTTGDVSAGPPAPMPTDEEEPGQPSAENEELARWQEDASAEPLSEMPRISFGHDLTGCNVELFRVRGVADDGLSWPPVIALRAGGKLHGICLTAAPLEQLPIEPGVLPRYYFEITVLEAVNSGTAQTMHLGFAWPPAGEPSGGDAPAEELDRSTSSSQLPQSRKLTGPTEILAGRGLPESVSELPYAFVVGGELPRAYMGREIVEKVSSWRPLKDATTGSLIGCLLEQDVDKWRLSILQDGSRRCKVEASPPSWATGPPHGLIDVCGSVSRVQIGQDRSVLEAADMC